MDTLEAKELEKVEGGVSSPGGCIPNPIDPFPPPDEPPRIVD